MPKCKRKKTLRSEILYAGKPSDLPVSDLPTYRQIIQFYHQIKAQNSDVNKPVYFYSREIEINLISLWTRVNPRLVLLTNIEKKIRSVITTVTVIKRKSKGFRQKKSSLDNNLDKLFDISACRCGLPTIPCDDKRIKCSRYE